MSRLPCGASGSDACYTQTTRPAHRKPTFFVHESTQNLRNSNLGKRYKLSFKINEKAFSSEGLLKVSRTPITDPKPIPAMKDVRLDKVLKTILARVPAPSGAALRVQGDHVEITTNAFLKKLNKKKK